MKKPQYKQVIITLVPSLRENQSGRIFVDPVADGAEGKHMRLKITPDWVSIYLRDSEFHYTASSVISVVTSYTEK